MSTGIQLTLAEYHRLIDRGVFADAGGRHIELIRGEVREMSPQGPPHHSVIIYLSYWTFENTTRAEVELSVQCPIQIPASESEPEPDIVWAKPGVVAGRHPEPGEIYLIIEVAHRSVQDDLGDKALLYAEAGIADYWVVEIPRRVVHVFRQPTATGYLQHDEIPLGGEVRPLHSPHVVLRTAELFA